MRALVFAGAGRVEHTAVRDPALEEPGDAIVRVRMAAICGSDLHVYRGLETGLDPGTVLGHEFLGEVVETGRGATRFRPGDLVVSPFTTSCGACFYCRSGLTSRCARGQLFGWVEGGRGLQGAQAEAVRVPLADTTLVAVPEGARPEEALLVGDVLATGWFGAESAGAGPGVTVAVVGCGPVGLMAVVAARELGADRVLALDTVAERLALAAELGAEPIAAGEGSVEEVRAATGGRGADAAVEAVGSLQATRLAFDLLRPGGTLAAIGFHTERQLAIGPGEAYDKNLTYRAGRAPVRRYAERLLPFVAARKVDLTRIVSHRLPLAEGPRGYDLFARHAEGCTKVLLLPGT